MGFSVAATAAIIGVSILMIIEISMGNVIPMYSDIQESYKDLKDRAINELQTMVTIQNVNVSDNVTLYDLNITVKNSGSTVFDVEYMNVLIEGVPTSFSSSSSYIFPESTSYLNLYGLSGSGVKKVKLILKNGISCYESYNCTI